MVICPERDVSCFSKIQIGFTFLVPAHPGSPGQRAIKRVCVCVDHLGSPEQRAIKRVCVCVSLSQQPVCVPGFSVLRAQRCTLNQFSTGHGRCASRLKKCGLSSAEELILRQCATSWCPTVLSTNWTVAFTFSDWSLRSLLIHIQWLNSKCLQRFDAVG